MIGIDVFIWDVGYGISMAYCPSPLLVSHNSNNNNNNPLDSKAKVE